MGPLGCGLLLVCASWFVRQGETHKTYADMFQHKHSPSGWFPFPIPPIPGWDPDSAPWNDELYPPLSRELQRHSGKPKVVLTSDSPALNGSSVTFTAKLQYPPCQKEGADGEPLWDEHCEDGTELEASANGQVRSGYVYNWTSWLEDYGYGKCLDSNQCNVFPDGKPFPQSNDWRHKNYVYVWHTRGQYYETCDGSSSSLSLNTSSFPLGAEVMEVLVYRQRERRKYSPLTTDSAVYHITDKIPVSVSLSQKSAVNMSDGVFFQGEELLFQVKLHDPSEYLKTAASVDFLWDFRDGNQLVTHRETITHTYSTPGRRSVKMVVEAAFPVECPPSAATATPRVPSAAPTRHPGTSAAPTATQVHPQHPPATQAHPQHPPATQVHPQHPPATQAHPQHPPATQVHPQHPPHPHPQPTRHPGTSAAPTRHPGTPSATAAQPRPAPAARRPPLPPSPSSSTPGLFSTEPLPPTPGPSTTGPWLHRRRHNVNANANVNANVSQCFRYVHGAFNANITIVEPKPAVRTWPENKIIDVTAARETKTDVSFTVKCVGSPPTSACTIVSDPSCSQVQSILCDDVPPSPRCLVLLRRSFPEPGTYCVNITLEDSRSMGLASTTVTINKAQEPPAPQRPHTAEVVISSSAVLTALFAFVAFMVYRRYRVYRPVRRILVDDALSPARVRGHMIRFRDSLFPQSEESVHLLTPPCPL
ncbi:protein QNR-71 [Boleophthalmus pectinirostris]|uniref:protein QNR-71 n=1 Tax=Boleophthalmus pectinirostris TaxID=150288 RepID=UPI00242CA9F2|nr:protein QNR-71 [Boleophthalmus pectinirostris]